MKEINSEEISDKYDSLLDDYKKLGINLIQALEIFLTEKKIAYLSINSRIKDKISFIEKIERKVYKNPFEEIEDICGIRIICYYQTDVAEIANIISSEFIVVENQDKEELLNDDQFGYRSNHSIVRIKNDWLKAPNYRGLENLKAEIQVRTILMHAWAEIEHKLSYKSKSQIPKQFKRKLFIMSAKLEEADEQFENIKNDVIDYKETIKQIAQNKKTTEIENIDLNLDSLQTFLDLNFPNRIKNIEGTAQLVDDFKKFNISLSDIINSYEIVKPYLEEIEKELFSDKKSKKQSWAQVGIAREIMDLTNENWRENRGIPEDYLDFDRKWATTINKKIKQK